MRSDPEAYLFLLDLIYRNPTLFRMIPGAALFLEFVEVWVVFMVSNRRTSFANVVLIPVAMGALYPLAGILLNPSFAAAAMACSSLFVLANALRLRHFSTRAASGRLEDAGA